MPLSKLSIVFVLTVITLAFFLTVAYFKLRRRFTRERYAFAALGTTVTLIFLAMASVGTAPPWTIFAGLLAHVFDNPALALPQPNWAEKALVLGLVAFALWLLHRNFVAWDGPTSERQHRMSRLQESSNYLHEGFAEVLRVLRREPPSPVYAPAELEALQLGLEAPSGTRSWRDDARELSELKWQQYVFDPDESWHEKHNCWVGNDIKTGHGVALMCCQEIPTQAEVLKFVTYVRSLPSMTTEKIDFIVAARTAKPQEVYADGQVVRIECEDSMLQDLVDFTDYVVDIKRRVERDCLPDSDLTIINTYTPSEIVDAGGNELTGTLEDYLLSWLAEPGQRHLAVLGEYGQGKSTGTLMFTHRLLTKEKTSAYPVPLFLELRGKSPNTLQPTELLGAWASAYRIDPRALLKLLINGRVFIIFEGFDEMAGVADREARINHFRALWRFAYPKAKLLFTGRPNFFLDDSELRAALGIGHGRGSGPYCEHVYLNPFGLTQISDSLRWATSSARNEILDLADKDEKFRDIVSRPSLLYIVARLWGLPEFSEITKTVDAAKVMGAFVQHCYRRQTEKHRGFPRFMVLTEKEREYFMDGIAAFMAAGRMPNQITGIQFERAIAELYAVIPDNMLPEASLPEPFEGPLKKRLRDRDDAIEAVQTDVRTYGLLVRDLSRPSAFKFPHKSFFEYLIGAFVADCLLCKREIYCAAIRSASGFNPITVVNVPDSLSFIGEIFSRNISPQGQPKATVNTLFDVIVSPRFRTLPFLRKLHLRLIVFRRIRPIVLPIALMFVFGFLLPILLMHLIRALLPEMQNTRFLFFLPPAVVSIFMIPFMMVYMRSDRKWGHIAVWCAVSTSMGIRLDDLKREYGKRTAEAIVRIAAHVLGFEILEKALLRAD